MARMLSKAVAPVQPTVPQGVHAHGRRESGFGSESLGFTGGGAGARKASITRRLSMEEDRPRDQDEAVRRAIQAGHDSVSAVRKSSWEFLDDSEAESRGVSPGRERGASPPMDV